MSMLSQFASQWVSICVWGLVATVVLTTLLYGSQGFGLSRLNLSFLMGTFFTGNRSVANISGFVIYLVGGQLFAFLYFLIFISIHYPPLWVGTVVGIVHGLFLLAVVLPLLPYIHPRMATEYDSPTNIQRLEPPGFAGLNYGYGTPLTTLLAHAVYGVILGACFQVR